MMCLIFSAIRFSMIAISQAYTQCFRNRKPVITCVSFQVSSMACYACDMANSSVTLQEAIVQVLKNEMDSRKISYRKLEDRTGINTGTISKIFSGENSLRIERLDQLCDGIGVDIFDVMKRAKQRTQ